MPPTAAEKTWECCLTHISDQISTQSFRTWFAPITPLSFDKNDDAAELRLAVPDAFHTEWLESHYAHVIRKAAADVIGRDTSISYEVAPAQTRRVADTPASAGETGHDRTSPGGADAGPASHRGDVPSFDGHPDMMARFDGVTSPQAEERTTQTAPPGSGPQASPDRTHPKAHPRATNPRTTNHEPRTTNHEPRTTNHEPRTTNRERHTPNHEPRTPNPEPRTLPHPHSGAKPAPNAPRPPLRRLDSRLKSEYTFESFIEGDCNRLARSASVAIAQNPGGTSFNPFMVYGGVGLGKTHIVQAIGNYVNAQKTTDRILYVSSEQFTSQFVRSIQENRVSDFSNFYRQIDVLIVDDVQFFGRKEKTQEEFFHVFNDLHQTGKQIILCADRPPAEISGIEERLLSRFNWGLSADIQAPDLETRIAILQHKAARHNVSLHPDVVHFVAERVKANIRQLEGALLKLSAHGELCRREIDPDSAKEILRDMMDDVQVRLEIEDIQRSVAQYYGLAPETLSAKTRKREIVTARHVAMYFSKQMTSHSLKSIGLRFGGRDHSTVIHACNSVEDRLEFQPGFKDEVEEIQKSLDRQTPPRAMRMRNQVGVA